MTQWRTIPKEVVADSAPFDGEHYLIWADSACTNIVRLAWWNNGDDDPEDRGWWSYRHSVTQEHLDFLEPAFWAEFDQPAPLADEFDQAPAAEGRCTCFAWDNPPDDPHYQCAFCEQRQIDSEREREEVQ